MSVRQENQISLLFIAHKKCCTTGYSKKKKKKSPGTKKELRKERKPSTVKKNRWTGRGRREDKMIYESRKSN